MKRERVAWIGSIAVLLIGGWLVGRQIPPRFDYTATASFRWWFWEYRALDLAVQVGLMFAGALGIAALLPSRTDEDEC